MAEDGISNWLQGKTAGIPNLLILAVVGVGGGWLIYRSYRQQPAQTATTDQTSSGNLLASQLTPPPVTYVTGIPEAVTAPTTGPAAGTSSSSLQVGSTAVLTGASLIPLAGNPGSPQAPADTSIVGSLPPGTQVTITGPATTAWWSTGPGTSPGHPAPYTAVPIQYLGQRAYVNAINLQPSGLGGGGESPWELFQQRWRSPMHLFGGLGAGPGAGARHLHQVAQQAGLPRNRVLASNGHLRGRGWRAGRGDVVRLA